MRSNPGELPYQRPEFARLTLFGDEPYLQLDMTVSAQKFTVSSDADAEARLWTLDQSAPQAFPNGRGLEFGIEHILRVSFIVVCGTKKFTRLRLEAAVGALEIASFLIESTNFSNQRSEAFRLLPRGFIKIEQLRVFVCADDFDFPIVA
jgi:hypothetical protein